MTIINNNLLDYQVDEQEFPTVQLNETGNPLK